MVNASDSEVKATRLQSSRSRPVSYALTSTQYQHETVT